MAYECRVERDSLSPWGARLTTFVATYPMFMHDEVLTHKVLSRNSASSRAIPVKKMLAMAKTDPYIPVYWGKAQSGMQAREELNEREQAEARIRWLRGLDRAILTCEELLQIGLHKQTANRVLGPYLWITTIISGTEWENFFNLRAHPDAQPEFEKLATMMKEQYLASRPTLLEPGEWHLPLVQPGEIDDRPDIDWRRISVGRCARVSYLTHDGRRDLGEDLRLCDDLQGNGHMSPFEHVGRVPLAEPMFEWSGNFKGFIQYRKTIPGEEVFRG